ncbi:alpha carbonic anhydrase 1, chloroplastic-like [Chenopodium quinoa]|uniref:Alpha-carbonic anhydrase domain-containing protein n=1 Tax=Chenopodium quinoa TaxID=63459 RepID=A0A803L2V0_CHEQI|nr:alpha carbonic anhydrase 1, chloroplastic-like [Chenopodium quinoa]
MAFNSILIFFFGVSFLFIGALASGHPAVCSSGKRQSPVDINTYFAILNKTLEPLEREYHFHVAHNTTFVTDGKHLEISLGGSGGLKIYGKTYNLTQLLFHTPSEHRFNSVPYAAELQQIHEAADGSRAVVAILFKYGPPSPFIYMLKPQLQELAKKPCTEQRIDIPKFDLSFLRKWPRDYYRYLGSHTSPPCDENVIWNVLCEAKTISMEQVDELSAPLCEENKNNARPVQPLNGRKVETYDEV